MKFISNIIMISCFFDELNAQSVFIGQRLTSDRKKLFFFFFLLECLFSVCSLKMLRFTFSSGFLFGGFVGGKFMKFRSNENILMSLASSLTLISYGGPQEPRVSKHY